VGSSYQAPSGVAPDILHEKFQTGVVDHLYWFGPSLLCSMNNPCNRDISGARVNKEKRRREAPPFRHDSGASPDDNSAAWLETKLDSGQQKSFPLECLSARNGNT